VPERNGENRQECNEGSSRLVRSTALGLFFQGETCSTWRTAVNWLNPEAPRASSYTRARSAVTSRGTRANGEASAPNRGGTASTERGSRGACISDEHLDERTGDRAVRDEDSIPARAALPFSCSTPSAAFSPTWKTFSWRRRRARRWMEDDEKRSPWLEQKRQSFGMTFIGFTYLADQPWPHCSRWAASISAFHRLASLRVSLLPRTLLRVCESDASRCSQRGSR